MTSTLPRLPAKYRGFGSTTPMNPIDRKYTHAQTQQISNKVFQPSKIVKKKSSNLRLQGIKEAAMRKYETYLSQIRQMERTFQLELKKTV